MMTVIKFFLNFTNFCVMSFIFTKLQISSISFSTAVNAEFVAKPLMFGILFSISVILAS